MPTLKGTYVSFNKSDLAHLDDGQLKIICVFPQITNRLAVLEAQVYGHMNVALDASNEQAKRAVAICGFIESLILIAGELKEAWEAIQQCYYGTKVAKTMNPALPKEIQERLKRCGAHCSGDSLLTFLRNNFAYHNSPSLMLDAIKATSDDSTMAFYVLDQRVFYFDYATQNRMAAIAQWLGVEDPTEIIHPLMQGVLAQAFNDIYLPMVVIAHTILLTVKNDHEQFELRNVPDEMNLRSDVFFEPRLTEE